MSEARSKGVKSSIVGLSLDSAVGAEPERWEALAVVELEDWCGCGHHDVRITKKLDVVMVLLL